MKTFAVFLCIAVSFSVAGCGGGVRQASDRPTSVNEVSNSAGANGNSNSSSNEPGNRDMNGNRAEVAPGIPANANQAANIPEGATPTPGIPDAETLRKQLERKNVDANVVNRPARTVKTPSKPSDPIGRPRQANSN